MAATGKGPLRIALENWLSADFWKKLIKSWFQDISEWFELETARLALALLRKYLADTDLPADWKGLLDNLLSGEHQGALAVAVSAAGNVGTQVAGGLMQPLMMLLNYAMARKVEPARLDPEIAIPAKWRKLVTRHDPYDDLQDLGWNYDRIATLEELMRPRVSDQDIVQLMRRFPQDEGRYKDELAKRGWIGFQLDDLLKATQVWPTLTDIIRFAVREVYSPEIAQRFGLFEDYPQEVDQEAQRIGLDPEYAKRYWAAHWELPSVSQGFEMLHRLRPGTTDVPFTLDDMKALLRALDYSPYWRDRLIQISYLPYTRVDARRMYKMGVLTKEQLIANYMDEGYDQEHAEKLADWTAMDMGETERDLTRSAIQQGYDAGLLSRDDAISQLKELGYSQDEAEFWCNLIDYQNSVEQVKLEVDRITSAFELGEISETDMVAQLTALALPAAKLETIINQAKLRKRKSIKTLSDAQIQDAYEADIIGSDDVQRLLQARGYTPEQITISLS